MRRALSPLLLCAAVAGCGSRAPAHSASGGAPPRRTYAARDLALGAASSTAQAPDAPLDRAQVEGDVALLEYALDRGYGGPAEVAARARDAVRARLAGLVGRATTARALCDGVADAIAELHDARLGASLGARCGARDDRAGAVGSNLLDDDGDAPWGTDHLSVGYAQFQTIAIRRFVAGADRAWRELPDAIARAKRGAGIVVDLRGASGADDARGVEIARALADAEVVAAPLRTHRRATAEAAALSANAARARGDLSSRASDAAVSTRDAALTDRAAAAGADGGAREWLEETRAVPAAKSGARAFAGPVAVIVDGGCAAACEATVAALRQVPSVKVFGDTTAGEGSADEIGLVRLPASGVLVRVPTAYGEYARGGEEGVGLAPDVAVPRGKDAFDVAMDWLVSRTANARVVAVADYVVPADERDAERARLERLGVRPRGPEVVASKPFAAPYSRRSFVVPQSWFGAGGPPRRVYAPALLADLDALEPAMRRAYAGFGVAELRGWDWTAWFDSFRARLRAAGPTWLRTRDAFEPVKRYQATVLDNHTTIPLGVRFGARSRSWVLAARPTAPCTAWRDASGGESPLPASDPAAQVKEVERFDGRVREKGAYLVMPATRAPTAVRCGAAWIALRAAATPDDATNAADLRDLSGKADDPPSLSHLTPEIAYLRLPTFSKENHELRVRDQPSWDKPTGRERALVVDLRGNDGGDADMDALSGWIRESDLASAARISTVIGASCLYPALRWGYEAASSRGLTPPLSADMRGELQSALDDLDHADAPGCPAKWKATKGEAYARHAVEASAPSRRIVVVVDSACASDCEFMTQVLAKQRGALVVGVNTFGVAQFVQPGYSVLPNTRLPFRFALGRSNLYGDDRSFDGYGFDVDVLLDGDEAWTKRGLLRLVDAVAPPRPPR